MLSHSIQFPSWLKRGPWPYEAGIALLLIWLAECIRAHDVQAVRYAGQPAVKMLMVDHGQTLMAACWVVSAWVITGLAIVSSGDCSRARPVRVVGLLGASVIFGVIAFAFHATWEFSIGGGAYLLLTWRTFCVAVRVGLGCEEDA